MSQKKYLQLCNTSQNLIIKTSIIIIFLMSKSSSCNQTILSQQSNEQKSYTTAQPQKNHSSISADQQKPRAENINSDSTHVEASFPSQVFSRFQSSNGESSQIRYETQHQSLSLASQIQTRDMSSGLPNVGNTCYLNSAIQFLFGATTYRQKIIKSTSDEKVIKVLGKIFRFMQQQQENFKISVQLAELRRTLDIESMIADDAFQILNLFLAKSEPYSDLFRTQYVQNCRCNSSGQMIMSSSYLMVGTERCGRCDDQLLKKFEIMPQYLMFVGEVKSPSKEILISGKRYDFVGNILYCGDGQYGHYVCERLIKGKRYLFNDSIIHYDQRSRIGIQFYREGFQSKVLLYKHRRLRKSKNEIQRLPYRCYADCRVQSNQSPQMDKPTFQQNLKEIFKVAWDCLCGYGRLLCMPLFCIKETYKVVGDGLNVCGRLLCMPLFCVWALMQNKQTLRKFRRTTGCITMKSFYSVSEDQENYLQLSFIQECLL